MDFTATDGLTVPLYGFPLPWVWWNGVSSMEYDWSPGSLAVDALVYAIVPGMLAFAVQRGIRARAVVAGLVLIAAWVVGAAEMVRVLGFGTLFGLYAVAPPTLPGLGSELQLVGPGRWEYTVEAPPAP